MMLKHFLNVFCSCPMFLEQFFLDVHFLVEIVRHGEYFSEDPSFPATLMKSAFVSAGMDLRR